MSTNKSEIPHSTDCSLYTPLPTESINTIQNSNSDPICITISLTDGKNSVPQRQPYVSPSPPPPPPPPPKKYGEATNIYINVNTDVPMDYQSQPPPPMNTQSTYTSRNPETSDGKSTISVKVHDSSNSLNPGNTQGQHNYQYLPQSTLNSCNPCGSQSNQLVCLHYPTNSQTSNSRVANGNVYYDVRCASPIDNQNPNLKVYTNGQAPTNNWQYLATSSSRDKSYYNSFNQQFNRAFPGKANNGYNNDNVMSDVKCKHSQCPYKQLSSPQFLHQNSAFLTSQHQHHSLNSVCTSPTQLTSPNSITLIPGSTCYCKK